MKSWNRHRNFTRFSNSHSIYEKGIPRLFRCPTGRGREPSRSAKILKRFISGEIHGLTGNAAASRNYNAIRDSGVPGTPLSGAQPVPARGNPVQGNRDEMRFPADSWCSPKSNMALYVCVDIAPGRARGTVFSGSRGAGQGPSRLGKHSTKLIPSDNLQ